jgi:predicted unusual protein kinase regulating ubiquinone biosynthesis (AarF/ABC1/UbiB family)
MRRFLRLGGLVGRVSASMLTQQLMDLARTEGTTSAARTENLLRNATVVAETLGEMKGAAMKVGQMLSLHEQFLPPEVSRVLRTLQQTAPSVPFEVMQDEIEGQLDNFDELFEELEPEPIASASIGQVHRGRLRDGRRVAVKIQYPLIDRVIEADLANLRRLLSALFSLFSDADFEPLWQEVRDRLLEEIDYELEAANATRMAELHAEVPEIVIPPVVAEASSKRVLTMEYLRGVSPDEACSDRFPRETRDHWGQALFDFEFRGLFRHRLLHADPNLANFSFLEDGRVIVYDFGCMKTIPAVIAVGYAKLLLAATEDRRPEIPELLREMGVHRQSGRPLPLSLVEPYLDLLGEPLRESPPYTFGEQGGQLYREVMNLGLANIGETADLTFPRDFIFIDRALAGHFGNLIRLGATGPWRSIARDHAEHALSQGA